MPELDPRVDAYIEKAPEFARPILTEIRARLHAACPDVAETIKWSTPTFAHHGILAGLAAFKAHCALGFWKEKLLREDAAMGAVLDALGRVQTKADLPARAAFQKLVRRAMQLNENGVAVPRGAAGAKAPPPMHPDFRRALAADKKARAVFEKFSPSAKREYLEWIADAKKDDTRARRIEQAVGWIAEGKKRNWKYENC